MTRISLKEAYDNKDVVAQIYAIRDTAESAEDTAEQAKITANDASAHVDALIPEVESAVASINDAVENVNVAAENANTASARVDALIPDVENAVKNANSASAKAEASATTVAGYEDRIATAETEINALVPQVESAVKSANAAAESASGVTDKVDANATAIDGIENRVITAETEIADLQINAVNLGTEQVIEGKKTFASADGVSVTNDLSVGGTLQADSAKIGKLTVETNKSSTTLMRFSYGLGFENSGIREFTVGTSGAIANVLTIKQTPSKYDESNKGVNKAFVQDTNGLSNIAHNNQANIYTQKQTIGNASVTTEIFNEKTDNVTSFLVDLQNQANTSNALILALDSNDTTGQVRLRVQKKIGTEITTYYVPLTTEDTWM